MFMFKKNKIKYLQIQGFVLFFFPPQEYALFYVKGSELVVNCLLNSNDSI